jgi:parallel beta-helix repeat protein
MTLKKYLYVLLIAFIATYFIISITPLKTKAQPQLPIHNINTGLNYTTIQEAINAPETLDGHTIIVDAGTYYENIVINKTLTIIGENKQTTIIDGNGTGNTIYITASNVNITQFTIQNKGARGIYLFRSKGTNINNNIFTNVNYGIWLSGSTDNIITQNNISQNKYTGITISDSNSITISENIVSGNDFGVALITSNNNLLTQNNISSNNKDGIYFYSSNNNIILGNHIFSNNNTGIQLSESTNNQITQNNITQNNKTGITMSNSSNNMIFHNSFNNNTKPLTSINSTNSLDNGIEGNYWNDYNGTDSNQDGIGDTPYTIDENNIDNHPLMGAFTDFTITKQEQTYHIHTISNSTISNFNYNQTEYAIKFNITGSNDTKGFCRTMIPQTIINAPHIVLIDDEKINATVLSASNTTHTYLYFNYTFSTHKVTIASQSYYELLEKYNKLLEEYQKLNQTHYELLNAYLTLLTDFQQLNSTYSKLQEDYALLLNDYQTLNTTYHKLLDSYTILLANYATLNTTYNNMLANYTQLQGNYDSLQTNYSTLSQKYNILNSTYHILNSTYNNLLNSHYELETRYNETANELINIKNQVGIFITITIIETIVLIIMLSLGIKYYKTFNIQKKTIEEYQHELERISHFEGARARFKADVKERRTKIEQFEKKYNVNIKPHATLEDILTSIKPKEEAKEER